MAAEVWGAGWAKEWDEGKVEDRAGEEWARGAGEVVVWAVSSTAQPYDLLTPRAVANTKRTSSIRMQSKEGRCQHVHRRLS